MCGPCGWSTWTTDAITYITTTTTTTTTLAGLPQCTQKENCTEGQLCVNGTCQYTSDECINDTDCDQWTYCATRLNPNQCLPKQLDGQSCNRDHNCINGNCTAHTNNTVTGDYPTDYAYYDYWGLCVSIAITGCTSDTDCNATSYCNIQAGGYGQCQPKNGENGSCQNNNWCIDTLTCILGYCENSTTYTGDMCDKNHPNYIQSGQKIWSSCTDINSTLCPENITCFCGYITNTSSYTTCIQRYYNDQTCSLLNTIYPSIEQRYTDRDEACISNNCRGYTDGSELQRRCTAKTCLLNRDDNGNKQANTFDDQYCTIDQYCNIYNGQCNPRLGLGQSCTSTYECNSGLMCSNNGVCIIGNASAGQTRVEAYPSTARVSNGGIFSIIAYYKYQNGTNINGATCTLTGPDTNYFNISNLDLPYGSNRYESYNIRVIADTITRNKSIGVTCTKTGVTSATGITYVEILGTTGGIIIPTYAQCSQCPSGTVTGTGLQFGVKYLVTTNASKILNADCQLTITSSSTYYGEDLIWDGSKYTTNINLAQGQYAYTMNCSKAGYETAKQTKTITIISDTCNNGRQDNGENGIDCGGICITPCPSTCTDQTINAGESGTDCGGTSKCPKCDSCSETTTDDWCKCYKNTDCEQGFCRLHSGNEYDTTAPIDYHCRTPTCHDGWKNGGESCLDGYSYNVTNCWICPCSDEYSTAGCKEDGSESCNVQYGECIHWNCTINEDCPPLLIREDGQPTGKDRICLDGECRFKTATEGLNATINAKIYPLSNIIYKNGTTLYYLAYCSDNTNGFRITSDKTTHTQYTILATQNPNIPSNNGLWQSFGTDGKEKTDRIKELCEWNSGTLRYARILFHTEITDSTAKQDQIIDAIVLRDRFRVNATGVGDQINLTSNREAYFHIRGFTNSPYDTLNTNPLLSVQTYYTNITNTTSIEWYSNSTFGEEQSGIYGRHATAMFGLVASVVWDILFGWWMPTWSNWYIIPIFMAVGTVLPLTILFFIYMYLRSREATHTTQK